MLVIKLVTPRRLTIYDRTVRLQSADLALRRTGVENFQNSHKVANEHKLTSEEANFKGSSNQASNYYKPYRENKLLSKQALQEYHLGVAQHPDPSTSYQFLLQHGRKQTKPRYATHRWHFLHAACCRSSKDDLVTTLIYHPDLNRSEELAKREYQRVLDYTRSHSRQEEMKLIEDTNISTICRKKSGRPALCERTRLFTAIWR